MPFISTPGALAGQAAIVTGAARGIGAAVAGALAGLGARVLATDVRADEGRKVADGLNAAAGGQVCRFTALDVSAPADWRRAVDECAAAFGAPTVLVSNAGVMHGGFLETLTVADLQAVLTANTVGVLLGIQAVLAPMRAAGGGSIVIVASAAGLEGSPGVGGYAASKAAAISLGRTAAMELGRDGIRVNVVAPGVVDTPMVRASDVPAEERARWTAANPIARMGRPDELAAAIAFLAGPGCDFLTGAVIPIDGGMLTGHDHSAGRER
jgi:3alpha(or 20beta)-hydroxysteroid dehydrogenase